MIGLKKGGIFCKFIELQAHDYVYFFFVKLFIEQYNITIFKSKKLSDFECPIYLYVTNI